MGEGFRDQWGLWMKDQLWQKHSARSFSEQLVSQVPPEQQSRASTPTFRAPSAIVTQSDGRLPSGSGHCHHCHLSCVACPPEPAFYLGGTLKIKRGPKSSDKWPSHNPRDREIFMNTTGKTHLWRGHVIALKKYNKSLETYSWTDAGVQDSGLLNTCPPPWVLPLDPARGKTIW